MATAAAPPVNRTRLVAGLAALGVHPGDRLLVQSSLSSSGFIEGGPHTVIDALAHLVEAGRMAALLREHLRRNPLFLIEVFTPRRTKPPERKGV